MLGLKPIRTSRPYVVTFLSGIKGARNLRSPLCEFEEISETGARVESGVGNREQLHAISPAE